ncbi:MAG TPA: hypothetical protein VM638_00360, partial [Actinomycetota bacterium]|nr:hypothetical protein [Actinomycetota bacterium]
MEKRVFGILLLMALTGCAGGVDSAATADDDDDTTSPGYKLTDGSYQYVVDEVPNDTCWAPPKTHPSVPMTVNAEVVVEGNIVHVTPDPVGGVSQTFDITRSGDSLSGASAGNVDLNSQGLDCILHIESTLTGAVTDDDQFDATIVLNVSEAGGTLCGFLVGSLDANQLDQLPCSLTLAGT